MRILRKLSLLAAVMLGCVGCDQTTKTLAQASLSGQDPIMFFNGVLRLAYAENPGAFLSIGSEFPVGFRFWLFVAGGALGLAVLLVAALRDRTLQVPQVLALGLVIGGGCGNLIDRLNLGFVRDFMQLEVWYFRTGVFNLADLAITTGSLLLLTAAFWQRVSRGRSSNPSLHPPARSAGHG